VVQTQTANLSMLEDDIAAFVASFKPVPKSERQPLSPAADVTGIDRRKERRGLGWPGLQHHPPALQVQRHLALDALQGVVHGFGVVAI